jgi:hypothetical protein
MARKRDDTADEGERTKELGDDDGEEERRTHGQETHEDGKNAAGNKPAATLREVGGCGGRRRPGSHRPETSDTHGRKDQQFF